MCGVRSFIVYGVMCGVYNKKIKHKKGTRAGHLFQGRYKAILVDADAYEGEPSRYVRLNPVIVISQDNYKLTFKLSGNLYSFTKPLTGQVNDR